MHKCNIIIMHTIGTRTFSSSPYVSFGKMKRFESSNTLGPGPASLRPFTSMARQVESRYKTSENMNMGTSSRDDALKLYAIYTCKKS